MYVTCRISGEISVGEVMLQYEVYASKVLLLNELVRSSIGLRMTQPPSPADRGRTAFSSDPSWLKIHVERLPKDL